MATTLRVRVDGEIVKTMANDGPAVVKLMREFFHESKRHCAYRVAYEEEWVAPPRMRIVSESDKVGLDSANCGEGRK